MRYFQMFVEGRVQGVFYRACTEQEANRLGLAGWVRNCPDGQVELMVSGDDDKIEELAQWLWTGSPNSDVDAVTVIEMDGDRVLPRPFEIAADATD